MSAEPSTTPAWRRRTRGEHRWPAAVAVLVAVVLQTALPARMVPGPRYLLPALEVATLAVLVMLNPFRIDRESRLVRVAALVLTALVSLANAWSAVLLVIDLLTGRPGDAPS